jgi:hypothetical protein
MFKYEEFMNWLKDVGGIKLYKSFPIQETLYEHVIFTASYAARCHSNRELFIATLLHDVGVPFTINMDPEEKSRFYNSNEYVKLVNKFLTEDDTHYERILDLIKFYKIYCLRYSLFFSGPSDQSCAIFNKYGDTFVCNFRALKQFHIINQDNNEVVTEEGIKIAKSFIDEYVHNW